MRSSVAFFLCIIGAQAAVGIQADPEALEKLALGGVFFAPESFRELAGAASFKAFLLEKDPYADFLTADEYARFEKVRGEGYAGIGMQLERDATGSIYCYPDPIGPAAAVGVVAGDRLLTLDGQSVTGAALPTVVARASGTAGSSLAVDIARRDGRVRHLVIVRDRLTGPSVVTRRYGSQFVVRVITFTPNTRQELEFILIHRKFAQLILDLRGNRGGDLNAAIDCAMLFVASRDKVVSIRSKQGIRSYFGSSAGRPERWPVYIWQDGGTASAAEVFIAALTENRRAISIGGNTFGKGTRQDLTILRSGSALIYTTGYLLSPKGEEIDGYGVAPDRLLPAGHTATMDYLREAALVSGGLH